MISAASANTLCARVREGTGEGAGAEGVRCIYRLFILLERRQFTTRNPTKSVKASQIDQFFYYSFFGQAARRQEEVCTYSNSRQEPSAMRPVEQ